MPSSSNSTSGSPRVIIVGGGPVGLCLAALLLHHGVRPLVVEAREGYCTGSRAICISRRSLEILAWVGADRAVTAKALPWVAGTSYYRDREILRFEMPSRPGDRYAPMVNIQQYYVEEYVHDAVKRLGGDDIVRWSTPVIGVRETNQGVEVDVQPMGSQSVQTLHADYVVACDGGRSIVRDELGLKFQGMQYEGRYVIVDIEQDTERPVERMAWFDPPSNPGSTILMHRQPDNVWRIDYQIGDDEDALEAIKPENVLPRVQSHLSMIGETAPWKPLWISIYNAKCLTLERYRIGRTLLAGDAAHLVPIFGVRGLNSGLDDAANLAWKLAAVVHGHALPDLLDTYSDERVAAARENIAYGAKSTEFMAPPNFAFKLMREATVRLAVHDPAVRSLVNPRQSAPVAYGASPLTLAGDVTQAMPADTAPGYPAPDMALPASDCFRYLSQRFGSGFVALAFGPLALDLLNQSAWTMNALTIVGLDADGDIATRYGAVNGSVYLIRPDGYVLARWLAATTGDVEKALRQTGIDLTKRASKALEAATP